MVENIWTRPTAAQHEGGFDTEEREKRKETSEGGLNGLWHSFPFWGASCVFCALTEFTVSF